MRFPMGAVGFNIVISYFGRKMYIENPVIKVKKNCIWGSQGKSQFL
jgi:hypothetical protein